MHSRYWWIGLLLLSSVGCGNEDYRFETTWSADGSVKRTLLAPQLRVSPELRKAQLFEKFAIIGEQAAFDHAGPLAKLLEPASTPPELESADPPREAIEQQEPEAGEGEVEEEEKRRDGAEQPEKEKHPYIVASAAYGNVADLPDELHIADDSGQFSHLVRNCQQEDLGFVTIQIWEEQITEVVTLESFRQIRDELGQLGVKLLMSILQDLWGETYELAAVRHELDTTGLKAWDDLTDLFFVIGLEKGLRREKENTARFARVLEPYGLKLLDDGGNRLSNDDSQRVMRKWLTAKLLVLLKRHDKQPVTADEVGVLLTDICYRQPGTPQEQPRRGQDLELAMLQAWNKEYPDPEQGEAARRRFLTGLFGIYAKPLATEVEFDFELKTAGPVLETNGRIERDRRIRWHIDGQDVYPNGFTMRAEILVPRQDVQQKVLGASQLQGRDEMAEYVELLRAHPGLKEAVFELIKTQDQAALKKYLAQPTDSLSPQEAQSLVLKLKQLLGL